MPEREGLGTDCGFLGAREDESRSKGVYFLHFL